MTAVRDADRHSFRTILNENPTAANRKGSGGSTPLVYAALFDDAESLRLLLDHGADANARSEDGTTALAVAAGRYSSSALLKLLLDHGATVDGEALQRAVYAGDEAAFGLLVEHGADVKASAAIALAWAMRANCARCFDIAIAAAPRGALNVF